MKQSGRRIFVAGLCGIIGVGKTSALKRFKRTGFLQDAVDDAFARLGEPAPLVLLAFEPVKEWRANGWLKTYYDNQDDEAAWFQLTVFDSHVRHIQRIIQEAPPDRDLLLVQERTMYDQRLFWELQVQSGFRTADAHWDTLYKAIWTRWNLFVPEPQVLFFFQTDDVQTTMQRIRKRARAEEMGASLSETDLSVSTPGTETVNEAGGVKLDYQLRLLALHDAWFSPPLAKPPGAPEQGIPCVPINADAPFHEDDECLAMLSRQVAETVVEHWVAVN